MRPAVIALHRRATTPGVREERVMPKTKKEQPQQAPLGERQAERFEVERTGVDIPPADREVLAQPIDDRMKALLADHKAMGAR